METGSSKMKEIKFVNDFGWSRIWRRPVDLHYVAGPRQRFLLQIELRERSHYECEVINSTLLMGADISKREVKTSFKSSYPA